jgi:lipopolysaccharide heptosyltransferase II
MSDPARILIINPFGIGDVLFTTPLIRAIRQAFPNSEIAYLCNRRTEPIVRGNADVDQVVVYERDELVHLWRSSPAKFLTHVAVLVYKLWRKHFTLVVDVSLGERYSAILMLAGASRRFGFDYRKRGRFLTHRLVIDGYHGKHVIGFYRDLLRFMGVRLLDESLRVPVSKDDAAWAEHWLRDSRLAVGQPLVGIVPAGGVSWGIAAPFRRWTLEGFATVADTLADRHGVQVLVFGEASDRAICQQVVQMMTHRAVDVSGQTTLGQLVALVGRLDLVISNDGGPIHLAVSQGVKTVSIFGPVDPEVYGPCGPGDAHRVVYRADLPCRPCYHRFQLPPCPYERACLTTVTPEEVIAACEELLASASPAVAGGDRA